MTVEIALYWTILNLVSYTVPDLDNVNEIERPQVVACSYMPDCEENCSCQKNVMF
jgi:hypothetical protein